MARNIINLYMVYKWVYNLVLIIKNELSSKKFSRLFFFFPLNESAWRKPNPVFGNGFKLRRPDLILRLHKLFIVLLQLRSAAEEAGGATNILFVSTINEASDELGRDLDNHSSIRILQVLKRARPKFYWGFVRARSKGWYGGHWEGVACKTIDGENEVGLAWHELIVYGESRDRVSNEERVCMAHHHFRKLEHDLTSYVFPLQGSWCASFPEYEFHRLFWWTVVAAVKAWSLHYISHLNTEKESGWVLREEGYI